jgi:predicted RNase H-like HicB family nuclease
MLKSYEAIYKNGTLHWLNQMPAEPNKELRVLVVVNETQPRSFSGSHAPLLEPIIFDPASLLTIPDTGASRLDSNEGEPEEKIMMLKVVFELSEEGGYTVYVPSLPGCISEGDNKEEALTNIREAIELYLEPLEDDLMTTPNTQVMKVAI